MRSRKTVLIAAALLVCFRCTGLKAADSATPEQALKAAYLYNFSLYTEWPVSTAEGVAICIAGRDPFGSALEAISGKLLRGKPVIVRRLDDSSDFSGCHLLYLGVMVPGQRARIVRLLERLPVLSVAEAGEAEYSRPMILLVSDGKRIGFEVDARMARAAGLALSSQLLRLARAVH